MTTWDFRPISLQNFSEKIISKILAIRIARLHPKIIDRELAGFVRGRLIHTHTTMAQELTRDLSRKVTEANVILKLDMAKAYDRIEWRFLLRAMEVFGFSTSSRDLIYKNLANIGYQFRINGVITGNFSLLEACNKEIPYLHCSSYLLNIYYLTILNRRLQSPGSFHSK